MKRTDGVDAPRRGWSIAEAARSLGCSTGFMRNEAARGKLQLTRLGRRVVVLAEDLERYLARGRGDV